jgi:predicted ATPase
MLKDWSVSNFKAIAATRVVSEDGQINNNGKIVLKPLTIFCGANSSGKSSLLQSLLLIAQTMRNQKKDIPLILNGAFTSLGKFDDIKTKPSDSDSVQIRFTYEPSKKYEFTYNDYPFRYDLTLDYDDDNEYIKDTSFSLDFGKGKKEMLPELSNFELSINFGQQTHNKYYAKEKNGILYNNKSPVVTDKEFNNTYPDEKCGWNHFLPTNIKINGKHVITMLVLKEIYEIPIMCNGRDLLYQSIPDKLCELLNDLGSGCHFYNITKGVFFYLKDDLFSGIQGIDSLFDLKDFEFIHDIQVYPKYLNWPETFSNLPVSIQNEIIDRIDCNLKFIYKKIFDELSKIENFILWINQEFVDPLKPQSSGEEIKKIMERIGKFRSKIDTSDSQDEKKLTEFIIIKELISKIKTFEPKVQEKQEIKDFISKIEILYNIWDQDWHQKMEEIGSKLKTFEPTIKQNQELNKLWNRIDILMYFYDNYKNAKLCCDLFFDDFIASERIENYLSEISNYFSSKISYLGPLREDPKPLYPISESSYTTDIGKKGENTAAILALSGEDARDFQVPDWDNLVLYKTEKKTLREAVIDWLKYIGVVEDIEAELEQGGFTLKVKTLGSGHSSDLTNVGVGVSQIIPIVTMCLSAEEGSTLVIEQPELHLHPKMQTKLTDFFVAISQSGKQCIIETHSEHIINALRYQVAKTKAPEDEKLANDIQIYFVEKDKEGALFRSITMDKYAYISEWPEDFFDEAQVTNINTLKEINRKLEVDPPSE